MNGVYWYPFRSSQPWIERLAAQHDAEVADREAWLAGVQKRLGLITAENMVELEVIWDARLAGD